MNISVVGLNHKRAPVEVREKLAILEADIPRALESLPAALERVVLSTCNRVETYLAGDDDGVAAATAFFSSFRGVEPSAFQPYLYAHHGLEAARHLFRVAAGLDSMVVGETQILSQVKRAYRLAQEGGSTSRHLNKLFQHAFFVAKAVRAGTTLASCPVSIPDIAASLAEKIFQDLSAQTVLVVGAGETGASALEAFRERGARSFIVANRTRERAEQTARELDARIVSLESLPSVLPEADIVVSCVAREGTTLEKEAFSAALSVRRRPILVIDVSVPRSVDAGAGQVENVFLYNIDDLESIASDNAVRREKEVARGEEIVERETVKFFARENHLDAARVLTSLRERWKRMAEEELAGSLRALPEAKRKEIEASLSSLLDKLLAKPADAIKDSKLLADSIRRLFGLE